MRAPTKEIPELSESVMERFMSNILIPNDDGCYQWIGYIEKRSGYGIFKFNQVSYKAHRVSLFVFTGKVSTKLVVDHICRNRSCVRPSHLREVPIHTNSTENSVSPFMLNKQKDFCKHGHEFTMENTLVKKDGRRCRTCKRLTEKGRKRVRRVKT